MDFQIFLKSCKSEAIPEKFTDIINTLKNEISTLKTQLSKISSSQAHSSDSSENREISKEIISNFKEHWDLKMHIKELEEENLYLNSHSNQVRTEEKSSLLKVVQLNDLKKRKMLEELYLNMKEKQRLQSRVMRINEGSRKELLQLQIQVRSLKLEKVQLMEKNSNFKRQAEIAKKENSEKDEIISQMKAELEDMKKRIRRQKSAPNLNFPSASPEKDSKKPVIQGKKHLNSFHRPANSLHHARLVSKSKGKLTYFDKSIENFLKAYVGHKVGKENRSKTPIDYPKFNKPEKLNRQVKAKPSISPLKSNPKQSASVATVKPNNKRVLVQKDLNSQQKTYPYRKLD